MRPHFRNARAASPHGAIVPSGAPSTVFDAVSRRREGIRAPARYISPVRVPLSGARHGLPRSVARPAYSGEHPDEATVYRNRVGSGSRRQPAASGRHRGPDSQPSRCRRRRRHPRSAFPAATLARTRRGRARRPCRRGAPPGRRTRGRTRTPRVALPGLRRDDRGPIHRVLELHDPR